MQLWDWDRDLRKNTELPDGPENFNGNSHLLKRIVPTRNDSAAPTLNAGSGSIAPFNLPWDGPLNYRYIIQLSLEWLIESPYSVVRHKNLTNPKTKNSHVYQKFLKTNALNCAFNQGSKSVFELAIVDVSDSYEPITISRKDFFKTNNWRNYKEKLGFEDDDEHLDAFYMMQELACTKNDNFDIFAAAKNDPRADNLDSAAGTYYLNMECQLAHSMTNHMGREKIGIQIMTQSMSGLGNMIRSNSYLDNLIPKFMLDYNPIQLMTYKPVYEELRNAERVPLGEMAKYPIIYWTPASSNFLQNEVAQTSENNPTDKLRSNQVNIAILYKGAAPDSYVHESIITADRATNIVTHNKLNDIGNPVILHERTENDQKKQIFVVRPRGDTEGDLKWSVPADYSLTKWNVRTRGTKATNILNAERCERSDYPITGRCVSRYRKNEFDSNKVVQINQSEFKGRNKIKRIGFTTKAMAGLEAAKIMTSYVMTECTTSPGVCVSTALGFAVPHAVKNQIAENRKFNLRFRKYYYQSGFIANTYDQGATLRKAENRYKWKSAHPEERNQDRVETNNNAPNVVKNTLEKSLLGNLQQLREHRSTLNLGSFISTNNANELIKYSTNKINNNIPKHKNIT